MKLLIVDDNLQMRKMLRDILASKFEQIYEHDDGEGAIEVYEEYKPDFVLMDIKMVNIDGIQATKMITNQHPKAKIIIVSQYWDEDIIHDSYKAGAIKYFNKENLTELLDFFQTI